MIGQIHRLPRRHVMNIRRFIPIVLCATVAIALPVIEVANGTWTVPVGSTELAHTR
jgi:hypothetical protein